MCYAFCMKNALKKLRVWLIAAALGTIGIGVPFLVLVITLNLENTRAFNYPILLGLFSAVYLLIGFIWGDLYVVGYRRREKNWDGQLPENIKESAWSRRFPFYLAAASVFLVFISFEIIYWISGSYPFL